MNEIDQAIDQFMNKYGPHLTPGELALTVSGLFFLGMALMLWESEKDFTPKKKKL